MATSGRTPGIVITALILIFGIIHLGVGIGIVARYRQFDDIFQQSVGLAAYNIVIGIFGIAIGILGLFSVINQRPALSNSIALASVVLGVFAVASFIAAFAVNAQSINYIRGRLYYRVTTYIAIDNSDNIMDALQSRFQCCGENSWLDWGSITLSATNGVGYVSSTNTGSGTVSGTEVSTGTGTGTGSVTGISTGTGRKRRGRESFPLSSPLVQAVRRRRQVESIGSNSYNLPSSYGIQLPLSCCKDGGTTTTDSLGSYCAFNAVNGTNDFYIDGCLVPVANIVVPQVMGIAVINLCIAIFAFILLPVLMNMFPTTFDPNNPTNKQPLSNDMSQEQQQQQQQQQNGNGGYYMQNSDPNSYYSYTVPTQTVYQ